MTATPTNGWRPRHLSHSAIDKFVRCPMNYWRSYVLRKEFQATRPMLIGTLFGRTIETLHNYARQNDDVHSLTPKWVADAVATHYGGLKDAERYQLEPGDADLVERMVDMYRTSPGCPYPGEPEYKGSVYLPDRQRVPVPLVLYMDQREEDAPIIHEFKTGKWATHHEYGWNQYKVNQSPQAVVYWWFDKQLKNRDSVVKFTALGYVDGKITMVEPETRPDIRRVEELQETAAALWQAILNEDFPCSCGQCEVA